MKENLKVFIGRKIRQFRIEKGLTIEELAFRSQVHPNYLGDIERGKRNPSIINLEKISRGLGKPLGDIFASIEKSTGTLIHEKTPIYCSENRDRDVISLLKSLARNSEKDRKYIIQIAKSLSNRMRK